MATLSEFEPLESRLLFAITTAIPTLTALGDFNDDHKADEAIIHRDLAARNFTAEIDLGRGNGVFVASATAQIPNFSPTAITIGDVNKDGSADLIVAGTALTPIGPTPLAASPITASNNEVIILFGNGKGGFISSNTAASVREQVLTVPRLLSTSSVAVGDLDGDGFTDIAVLGQANAVAISSAAISSSSAIDILWDVSKPGLTPLPTSSMLGSPVSTDTLIIPPANPNVNALFVGDLDGEGHDDLVAAQSVHTALTPAPTPTPIMGPVSAAASPMALGISALPSPVATSVISPIRPDFVTVRFPTDHTPVVMIGVNPLDLALPVLAPIATFAQQQTIGLASLTRNGPLDLVGARGDSIVYVQYNPATQSFGPVQVAQSQNTPPNLATASLYLADIDGDGLTDLLAQTDNGVFIGHNIPSTSIASSVLFSWTRAILPPVTLITLMNRI